MPYAPSEGARIYYEETGRGTPILFIHEFGGDHRSWDDQMRHFGRGWRGITWGARGYPPSDCPADEKLYGQAFFERDAIAVLDAAKVEKAHIVGLSMGGYTALMLAAQVSRARDLLHGGGRGLGRAQEHAGAVHRGMPQERPPSSSAPARSTPRPWDWGRPACSCRTRTRSAGAAPSRTSPSIRPHAAAKTLRTVQSGRPSLYDLEAELKGIQAPVLLLVGDEDEPCLDVNLWMKRLMPSARLGHPAGLRPRHQPGGAGAVQPAHRAVHRRGGPWHLAAARCACAAGRRAVTSLSAARKA